MEKERERDREKMAWGKERERRTQIKYISEKASSLLNATAPTLASEDVAADRSPATIIKHLHCSPSCGVTKQSNNQFRLQTEEEEKEGWDERGREGS